MGAHTQAIQIDPDFVYAHTLMGHELVSKGENDAAVDAYRKAIARNPRHYNAWFGLGGLFTRQQMFDLALDHFGRAMEVFPQSPVLHCYQGMVRSRLGMV